MINMKIFKKVLGFFLIINSISYLIEGVNYFLRYTKSGLWLFMIKEVIACRLIIFGMIGITLGAFLLFNKAIKEIYKTLLLSYLVILILYHLFLYPVLNFISITVNDFIQICLVLICIYLFVKDFRILIKSEFKRISLFVFLLGVLPFLISLFIKYDYFR